MKKIKLLSVLALMLSIISCQEQDSINDFEMLNDEKGNIESTRRLTPCTLTDFFGTQYSSLGSEVIGPVGGNGGWGKITKYMNCNPALLEDHCGLFTEFIGSYTWGIDPINGGVEYLSDGVMTVSEQQGFIQQVEQAALANCTNCLPKSYDISFSFPLNNQNIIYVYVEVTYYNLCTSSS